jgi:hypothetical protein
MGHHHTGSNNFDLLKRERNVYYCCHSQDCSKKPPKKLGDLSLKAALQDAMAAPVDPHDDMQVITQYTKGTREAQDLLLRVIVEHAGSQAYVNLGRLFACLYMIEGKILATVNSVEKSRDPIYFCWNGSSWAQDSFNLVLNVFISQMGHLLDWYEMQRERQLGSLYSRHPDLRGFVVDGKVKPLDSSMANPKLIRIIKLATESCMKELDECMPSFGRINFHDAVDVRKYLHDALTELYVKDLLDHFHQNKTVANASNGLIDLRNGKLLAHHPQDLCNNCTSKYVQGALRGPTAKFRAFLLDILSPETIDWLQIVFGYCLTGETSEELFVIMNGLSGADGKGVLKKATDRAFGNYARIGNTTLFVKPTFKVNASATSTALMHIRSLRFAFY